LETRVEIRQLLAEMGELFADGSLAVVIYVVALSVVGVALDLNVELSSGYLFINSIANVVGGYLLLRGIVLAAGLAPDGEVAGFGSYFGMSWLEGLAFIIGLVLLVVPGIVLLVRWIPSFALLMCEKRGVTESMSLSWAKTRASFGPLLGATLLGGVPCLLVVVWLGSLTAEVALTSPLGFVGTAATNIVLSAMSVYSTLLGVACYKLLFRPHDDIAEIFA
jgi:hypothetical protein